MDQVGLDYFAAVEQPGIVVAAAVAAVAAED